MNSSRITKILAALLALAAALGVAIPVLNDGDGGSTTVTIRVDGGDADRKRDDTIELSEKAQDVAKDTERAEDTIDQDEPGAVAVPQAPGDRAHPDVAPDTTKELRGKDAQPEGVLPQGGASQTVPGCSTRFVGSYSARTRSVKAIGLHYTAGPNSAGLADMNGLTAYSNRNQVSWHFLIDREGHCYYSVPLSGKAWTIGNLNSETTNIEVVGRGNEGDYAGTAGARKLAQVVRYIGRVQNIPMKLGATDGRCNVTRRGIITHWMGGGCSGGHHDVKPYSITGIIKQIGAGGGSSVLRKDERKMVSRRCYHRKARYKLPNTSALDREHLKHGRYWVEVIRDRRAAIRKNGLTDKYQRKARHRLLGHYLLGKCS
jgi:hypothetical protein